jgi:hypothetical protein
MSAWNARIAMKESRAFGEGSMRQKIFECRMLNAKCLILFFSLIPGAVHAQQIAAPSLFEVREVLVRDVNIGNAKSASACGLSGDELNAVVTKTLRDNDVTALLASKAEPMMIDVARIEMVPEIVPADSGGLDCSSWVSLAAQSQNTLRVPPVDAPRTVTVVYWRQGMMVTSIQSSHNALIGQTLEKMALQFVRKYKQDQAK